jgi:mRNA-degrading endonuclease YafQ of YafQ-DinJ toxin-antitoxin module
MYDLNIHKDAEKEFKKTQKRILKKCYEFLMLLTEEGFEQKKFRIKKLEGEFKKFSYFEAIIDKDYRIIFRQESNCFYIRMAGTHNKLGTG